MVHDPSAWPYCQAIAVSVQPFHSAKARRSNPVSSLARSGVVGHSPNSASLLCSLYCRCPPLRGDLVDLGPVAIGQKYPSITLGLPTGRMGRRPELSQMRMTASWSGSKLTYRIQILCSGRQNSGKSMSRITEPRERPMHQATTFPAPERTCSRGDRAILFVSLELSRST